MQKKFKLLVLVVVLALAMALVLVACGGGDSPSAPSTKPNPGEGGGGETDTGLLDFTGITFADVTVDYDGNSHSLSVVGAPADATVTYTNNGKTDAGTYQVTATISKDGYNTLTKTATLTINKLDFTGITFANVTVDYDGASHSLAVTGAPTDATVTYSNNGKTDAGTYQVTATISKANYNTMTKKANLTINKIDIQGITFSNDSFEYDTLEHKIAIVGNVPTGSNIVYAGGENGSNGATNPGKYTITVTITNDNYNTLELSATLSITSKEEALNMTSFNGQILFQNPLDKNRFYTISNTGEIVKVNNDTPKGFVQTGTDLFYLSDGLLTKGLNWYDGKDVRTLFEISGEYLTTDGTNLYYAVSSITNKENNGIYALSIADLKNQSVDPVPVKLVDGKATWLTYADGHIYYSNKDDKGKLYRVNVVSKQIQKVCDYKVTDIIVDNNVLYYCKHDNLTAYLERMDVTQLGALPVQDNSTAVKKLTISKGKYLTLIGDYIFFVNTDMLTSSIMGDGVYKVKADGSSWISDAQSLLTGAQKVIEAKNDNVYALASSGDSLFYYRASNKHLYEQNMTIDTPEKDLMQGFVVEETKQAIVSKYLKTQVVGDEIYYINMLDNGRLYKRDMTSDMDIKVTNSEVADFVVNGDYLYYSTVRLAVNFDLYRLNLVNGELKRISTDKCMNLAINGEYIYYTNMSGSNSFNKMKIDGTEDVELNAKADDWAVTIVGEKVYYVSDGVLNVYDIKTSSSTIVNKDIKPNQYIILNNKIYYMNDGAKNSVNIYDIATNTITKVCDLGLTNDARSFVVYNDEVYFYRNVAAGSKEKGLYKITATNTVELVNVFDGKFISNAQVVGEKMYFIDAWLVKGELPHVNSTGALFEYDFTTDTTTRLN